jgi:predicted nucleotide-binding protein
MGDARIPTTRRRRGGSAVPIPRIRGLFSARRSVVSARILPPTGPGAWHVRIRRVPTIKEIVQGIRQLRKDLVDIRQPLILDESLQDARLKTWTRRVYDQLMGWGFVAEAEEGFGRNSAKMRDDRLEALRDDLESHPEHYASKLATASKTESASSKPQSVKSHKIFLGHGHNNLWARVHIYLKDEMHLDVEEWETHSRAGLHSVEVLKQALESNTFAVMVVTGEDATADGGIRARQNVVHEIGLFQGKLGFEKVALLQQDGIEEFSNLAGLQVISFPSERIESAFYELGRMLKREGLVK